MGEPDSQVGSETSRPQVGPLRNGLQCMTLDEKYRFSSVQGQHQYFAFAGTTLLMSKGFLVFY